MPLDVAAEWQAIALLEQALPHASSAQAHPEAAQACSEAASKAAAQLHVCLRPQQALYCAQLLVALQQPELGVRQLQRVTSALLTMPPPAAEAHLEVPLCFASFASSIMCRLLVACFAATASRSGYVHGRPRCRTSALWWR